MKMFDKIKSVKLRDMPGKWIRIVKHCPDMTKTFVHDYQEEVMQVACYLANGITKAKISKATSIFDDRDRRWISCLITTPVSSTALDHKILDYDADMNFSDVGFRFENTRINISSKKMMHYIPKDFMDAERRSRRGQ